MPPIDPAQSWALAIALLGGLVRGTTGFGAAMVMTPPLALLLGPRVAVPVSLLLETFAALTMLPAAVRLARWRVIGPIGAAAVLAVPLGGWLMAYADALTLRRLIAATVVLFSLALFSGRRYHGPRRLGTTLTLGTLSGAMLGATSIGGPPVILYLLSGPDPAAVTRANLTLYVMLISAAGLVMLAATGVLTRATGHQALLLAPTFVVGVLAGSRLFARFSDQRFRQLTILVMCSVALYVLFA